MSVTVAKTALVARDCKSNACKSAASGWNTNTKVTKGTPLQNVLYFSRSCTIHALSQDAVTHLRQSCSGVQLLLLGAGLDRSFETGEMYTEENGVRRIFAVDLPSVLQQREALEREQPSSCPAVNIAFDLNSRPSLGLVQLLQAAGFCSNTPTVVVLEMVMGYLDEIVVQTSLLPLLASLPVCIVSYDVLLDLRSSYGAELAAEFARHGAPLRCLRASPSAHAQLFVDSGFKAPGSVVTVPMTIALGSLFGPGPGPGPGSKRLQSLKSLGSPAPLLMDEYGSLGVLHQRYSVTVASSAALGAVRLPISLPAPFSLTSMQSPPLLFCNCASHRGGENDNEIVTDVIRPVSIDNSAAGELSALAALYTSCFEPWAQRYAPVRRFTKAALKAFAISSANIETDSSGFAAKAKSKSSSKWGKPDAELLVAVHSACGRPAGCVAVSLKPNSAYSVPVDSNNKTLPPSSSSQYHSTPNLGVSEAELQLLCVSESRRGEGLGKRLVQAALCRASEWGPQTRIHLSVLRDQAAALRVYDRCGFVQCGEIDCGGGCILLHLSK